MAKAKGPNGSVQNRHIFTRASYLYQAATYLSSLAQSQTTSKQEPLAAAAKSQDAKSSKALMNTSRQALSGMRSITLKTQIRCAPAIKRSVCKFCDTLLVEGRTCVSGIENKSKGGRKPWADVLVVRCGTCGHVKRFPVGERRRGRGVLDGEGVEGGLSEDTEKEKEVGES